ncbi:FAD-dependent oxidoreductase [Mangrovicoccus sp. HB161399]|uniref:FAD-dependent oxidoreductase n=1 Tax=Mangrovicoccus sp. HB161399 TaxID=2720392 RepID=UPI0015582964|nr:FAD-dependent oxidoreductase [Mangrovicoccus sp. HB161399]
MAEIWDAVVLGSGGAGLMAALRAAAAGLRVMVLEAQDVIGGTTAMSGAGLWVPGNHLAQAAGIADSPEEAAAYLAAAAPPGWAETETPRWQAFAGAAPRMLRFLEAQTALRFALSDDSDPYPGLPGGKARGRMVSTLPLAQLRALPLQPPHIPHVFTYQETRALDPWHRPARAVAARLPQLAWRVLRGKRAQGTALVSGLAAALLARGGAIRTGWRAAELLMTDGRVTGVAAMTPEGLREIAARHVVIATGGFERDEARRAAHFAGPLGLIASAPGNLGCGQRMAEAAGAQMARMDQANIAPALPARLRGAALPIGTFHHREPGALLIGRDGRRFVNEYLFNLGEVLAERGPDGQPRHLPAWLVFDEATLRSSPVMRHLLRRHGQGIHVTAESPEALAARISVPPAALAETVARYSAGAETGTDDAFGRHLDPFTGRPDGIRRMAPLRRAPFHALPFNLSFLGTKGGPMTDGGGRVLRPDGRAIPGLYACGLAMANPIGTRAAGSGTTLGPNLTWGFLCGESIAAAEQETQT